MNAATNDLLDRLGETIRVLVDALNREKRLADTLAEACAYVLRSVGLNDEEPCDAHEDFCAVHNWAPTASRTCPVGHARKALDAYYQHRGGSE